MVNHVAVTLIIFFLLTACCQLLGQRLGWEWLLPDCPRWEWVSNWGLCDRRVGPRDHGGHEQSLPQPPSWPPQVDTCLGHSSPSVKTPQSRLPWQLVNGCRNDAGLSYKSPTTPHPPLWWKQPKKWIHHPNVNRKHIQTHNPPCS